mmetsp:Transcript_8744/g.25780  ORF Transcript_8744/g.25780 Transcript_8744/m.25780 type:complete len:203 (+) Transcript_8744:885-1493(+)
MRRTRHSGRSTGLAQGPLPRPSTPATAAERVTTRRARTGRRNDTRTTGGRCHRWETRRGTGRETRTGAGRRAWLVARMPLTPSPPATRLPRRRGRVRPSRRGWHCSSSREPCSRRPSRRRPCASPLSRRGSPLSRRSSTGRRSKSTRSRSIRRKAWRSRACRSEATGSVTAAARPPDRRLPTRRPPRPRGSPSSETSVWGVV